MGCGGLVAADDAVSGDTVGLETNQQTRGIALLTETELGDGDSTVSDEVGTGVTSKASRCDGGRIQQVSRSGRVAEDGVGGDVGNLGESLDGLTREHFRTNGKLKSHRVLLC